MTTTPLPDTSRQCPHCHGDLSRYGMVPDFYASNEDALEDIKKCAAQAK